MAEVKLELGGLLDIASGSELKSLSDQMTSGFNGLRKRDPRPIFRTPAQSAVQTGSASVILNLGGPASGRLWIVHQLFAAGVDAFTSEAAHFIAWFITGNPQSPGLTEMLNPGTQALPMSLIPASADAMAVQFGEYLVAQVNGLTVGNPVTAGARLLDFADSAEELGRI